MNISRRIVQFCRVWAVAAAGLGGAARLEAVDDFEAPPINYSQATPDNVISRLQQKLDAGEATLAYEPHFGHLRSLLKALDVPTSSQTLVFSKTSLQRQKISPQTPRSLFFNDEIYIGFCQAGDVLEISAVDPQLGTVFYTIDEHEAAPKFIRQTDNCLICHASSHAKNVPGHMVRSVYSDPQGYPLLASGTYRTDHSSPLKERWGGWYVTGTHGSQMHLGNAIFRNKVPDDFDNRDGLNLRSLEGRFDRSGYVTPHSDIAALMLLEHQAEGHNLLTRANFQTRLALAYEADLNRELGEAAEHRWESTTSRIKSVCEPLVEYLLMKDEAPLEGAIRGTSGFADEFTARGPFDSRGRSLRELDLRRRLFRYPCSYLIYSASFDALPAEAKRYVFRRMHEVLAGRDKSGEFKHLSDADRRAIREILTETKPEFAET